MATLFLDYENGNDNYAGTSFDLLASGTDGRISSSTFSSAGASFPNDGSLIGQYLSIFNGSSYIVYRITAWVSSTSLTIAQIPGGTSLSNQSVDRQYYVGGRWQTLTNGATSARIEPGDTIRVMGSPAPTSIGSASWVSGKQEATVSPGNGQFTNATPIVVNRTNHGLTTGDVVVVTGVTGNTNANGTWDITVINNDSFSLDGSTGNGTSSSGTYRLRNNTRVKLASPLTQTIASTGPRSAWTASANVTAILNTADFKEHNYSDSIAATISASIGKVAYYATGALDLSAFQQISFWFKRSGGLAFSSGYWQLKLCSDTTGDTSVHTIDIPSVPSLSQWIPVTVDLGTNLGSNIQSIALYVTGAVVNVTSTLLFNNIIACKASSSDDALTLTSLIGKNINDDTWYGIQSINGARVFLDSSTNTTPITTSLRGYMHPSGSETVTTYKREAIKTAMTSGVVFALSQGGTSGSPIYIEGGWDRTSMSTQNLETWYDGQYGLGTLTSNSVLTFYSFNKIGAVRYAQGFNHFAAGSAYFRNIHTNNCSTGFIAVHGSGQSDNNTCENVFAAQNSSNGCQLSFGNGTVSNIYSFGNGAANISLGTTSKGIYDNLVSYNASGDGITCNGSVNCIIKNSKSYGNGAIGFNPSSAQDVTLTNCDARYNSARGFSVGTGGFVKLVSCNTSENNASFQSYGCNVFALDCTFNEVTELYQDNPQYRNFRIQSQNHDNTSGNHRIFTDYGLIIADTTTRHAESGFSWKLSPLSSTFRTSDYPLDFRIAKVAVAAYGLVTVKAWMYRDNSDLTMRLVCKGGQIAGVASDVTSAVTAVDSWEEQTITFTPTEQGVVEITAEAYGGSTYNGWVDDMTISQAV